MIEQRFERAVERRIAEQTDNETIALRVRFALERGRALPESERWQAIFTHASILEGYSDGTIALLLVIYAELRGSIGDYDSEAYDLGHDVIAASRVLSTIGIAATVPRREEP